VDRTVAMVKLQQVLSLDAGKATQLLWHTYQPWRLWVPFAAIGVASAIGIAIYARWVRRYEAADG
jgi:POT family proton-dependent oligopeptide transporter